jgi:hypothetical protein
MGDTQSELHTSEVQAEANYRDIEIRD